MYTSCFVCTHTFLLLSHPMNRRTIFPSFKLNTNIKIVFTFSLWIHNNMISLQIQLCKVIKKSFSNSVDTSPHADDNVLNISWRETGIQLFTFSFYTFSNNEVTRYEVKYRFNICIESNGTILSWDLNIIYGRVSSM